ncbi:MAG: efflux RND transporter periplasmic adaptor subunit [Bacteroidetes bacterium]|nr:efflux RND transporter periplasmic adaptor subunit [Bacteroidota bacterium]
MRKRNLLYIIAVVLLLASCGGKKTDLDKLNKQKDKLTSKIKKLEGKLTTVENQIAELDTTKQENILELVNVEELKKTTFKHYIEAQGKTYSENNITITTDMGGLVKAIYVQEGQRVSKGQTLIQLDNSVVLNQIAELETALTLAKDVYDKRKRLWDQNIGSEIEFLQAKNNYESLINKKATANTQLSKLAIKAPINGYIDAVSLKLGEMAAPGYPAATIVNNTDMEVKIDLPEAYLGKVKVGDEILVDVPTLNTTKEAKVSAVGQTVNQFNRAFQITAKVDNKENDLKPNMLVEVKFLSKTFDNVIVIPAKFLQESAKGFFVFTAKVDNATGVATAHKINIEISDTYNGEVVVDKGLNAGDLLIKEGFRYVLDQQEIELNKTTTDTTVNNE